MITTKAYIVELPEEGNNIFKVNIPLMTDNVSDDAIFNALLCSSSGSYNDYKVGDCVFVDFEDDKYNMAIILGKLYTEVPEDNEAYGLFNELKVTGSATLPISTKFGPYSAQDIFNLYQAVGTGTGTAGIDEKTFFEYLKLWVKKDEFNTFFGDSYFNSTESPFAPIITFNNNIETSDSEGTRTYNTNYKPNYNSLINTIKEFIQVRFNKFIGLQTDSASIPSITQFLSKINNSTWDSSSTTTLPDYMTLATWAKNAGDKFVRYTKTDNSYGDNIKVMDGNTYSGISKDSHTFYFLTSVPTNNSN